MALGIMLWDLSLILWGLNTSNEIFNNKMIEKRCFIKITLVSVWKVEVGWWRRETRLELRQ